MRREDVRAGGVYAHYKGKLTTYSTFSPALVLSTDKHRAVDSRLVLAPDLPMRSGSWKRSTVGMPAVIIRTYQLRDGETIASRTERARQLARLEDFYWYGKVTDDDGTELGTYDLVTTSASLHGDYTAVAEQRAADEKARADYARSESNRKEQNAADYAGLTRRLQEAGVTLSHRWDDYHASRQVTVTFEELTALLDRAEGSQR